MDPADEVRQAIEHLFDAIIRRNVDAIQAHYLKDDRLFIFREGWEGKIEGFDRETNAALWQGLFDQVTYSKIELTDDVRVGRYGDLGWVGGTTASTHTPAGATETVDVQQQATWILERHEARWMIVFEHVSFLQEKPFGAESASTMITSPPA